MLYPSCDAEGFRLVSLNREARRIVESLRTPGHPSEQLVEVSLSAAPTGAWCH